LHLANGDILTGTMSKSSLTLVLPSQTQTPEVLTFQQRTADDFNQTVQTVDTALSSDKSASDGPQTIATAIVAGIQPTNDPFSVTLGGVSCDYDLGATGSYWGLRANYACSDGSWLYGSPVTCSNGSECVFSTKIANPTTGLLSYETLTSESSAQLGDPRCAFLPAVQEPTCYKSLQTATNQITECDAGFLGVGYQEMSTNGDEVTSVYAGSPAASAGLQVGDFITQIDGFSVGYATGQLAAIALHIGPGGTVTVTYQRYFEQRTASLTLAKRPGC
jgi:hypothetical protein